jgi:hypothetical protein
MDVGGCRACIRSNSGLTATGGPARYSPGRAGHETGLQSGRREDSGGMPSGQAEHQTRCAPRRVAGRDARDTCDARDTPSALDAVNPCRRTGRTIRTRSQTTRCAGVVQRRPATAAEKRSEHLHPPQRDARCCSGSAPKRLLLDQLSQRLRLHGPHYPSKRLLCRNGLIEVCLGRARFCTASGRRD